MANSIDFTTLSLGAIIGIGCREQLKAAGRVAASAAASLADVAAKAAADVAAETQETKSPEQAAAQEWLKKLDQQIDQKLAGLNGQGK